MARAELKRASELVAGAILAAGLMTAGAGIAAADTGCETAGSSGFTAAVVATAGQTISRRAIDATGCDVGIYVADDAANVTISAVTVTGANGAGILVENTSHVTITRSTVTGNGFNVPPGQPQGTRPGTAPVAGNLPQAFGISLFGVSDSTISRNTVTDNGRGGIGVMDTGPFDPGHILGLEGASSPDTPVPVTNVTVSRNFLSANYDGCAIVVSAFNEGNTVNNVTITRNTITGIGFNEKGADVGGIVAQSNGLSSTVSDITISRNTVTDSVEGGIIVHAAAPGSKTVDVQVTRNTLSGNNIGNGETSHTTGVVVSTLGPATNEGTVVARNTIKDQFYGVWTSGPNPPTTSRNAISVSDGGVDYYEAP